LRFVSEDPRESEKGQEPKRHLQNPGLFIPGDIGNLECDRRIVERLRNWVENHWVPERSKEIGPLVTVGFKESKEVQKRNQNNLDTQILCKQEC
jgi:hypothetical protein